MSEYQVQIDTIPHEQDCFGKPSEYEAGLRERVSIEIPDEQLGKVWVSASPPPADKTDWLWAKTNNDRKPIGLLSWYTGAWRPWYPKFEGPTVIQPFNGDPTLVEEPWALCDGTNGTVDLRSLMTVESGTMETAPDPIVQPLKLGYMQFVGYS